MLPRAGAKEKMRNGNYTVNRHDARMYAGNAQIESPSANGKVHLPEQQQQQRKKQIGKGPAKHSSLQEPLLTKPLHLSAASPRAHVESSSSDSCTSNDLRLVEEELKELLSGYHRIVGTEDTQRPKGEKREEGREEKEGKNGTAENENAVSSSVYSHSQASSSLPQSKILLTSPLAEVAPTTGKSSNNTNHHDQHGNNNNNHSNSVSAMPSSNVAGVAETPQAHRSLPSLPVSSVHGERSTDENTPTPCVQLPQHLLSTTTSNGFVENANPSARVASPVDLFAEALTEDQLNRSFEMQWQREQKMQMIRQHLQPGIFSFRKDPNNQGRPIPLYSYPFVGEVGEDYNDDMLRYPADRQEADSPVPFFANRREYTGIDNAREVMSACHGLYDSRVYTAYRYPKCTDNHGSSFAGDANRVKGTTEGGEVGDTQSTASPFSSEPRNGKVDVHHPHHHHRRHHHHHHTTQKKKQKQQNHSKNILMRLDDNDSTHFKVKVINKPERRRGASSRRHRREVVNSTTPEIATSPRRTENPSMRSGATGGKRTPITGKAVAGMTASDQYMPGSKGHNGMESIGDAGVEGVPGGVFSRGQGVFADYLPTEGTCKIVPDDIVRKIQERQYVRSRRRFSRVGKKTENYAPNRHANAATRFHYMVERHIAAFDASGDSTSPLPAFADSLVGAAISDFCPAVRRRQAQLKESQHAEAAAAAADASHTRNTYRGSIGTITSTSSTTPTPSTNVRSSWDSHGHRRHNNNNNTAARAGVALGGGTIRGRHGAGTR